MGESRLLERGDDWYLHVSATREVEEHPASEAERAPVGVDIGDAALTTVCHRDEHGAPTAPEIHSDEASTVHRLRETYFTTTRRLKRRGSKRILEEYVDSLWDRIHERRSYENQSSSGWCPIRYWTESDCLSTQSD